LECIIDKKVPHTDGMNGLRVVQILEAAQQSLENKGVSVVVPSAQSAMTHSVNGKSAAVK